MIKIEKHISQQELEAYLWGAAKLLRGLVDAGDYKQYIFPLLFFKRLSDVWDEETSISELGGLLIVRQNPRVHERVKALLASIRLMKTDGAFAAVSDQADAEAKKIAAERAALTERIAQLEQELQTLRKLDPTKPTR